MKHSSILTKKALSVTVATVSLVAALTMVLRFSESSEKTTPLVMSDTNWTVDDKPADASQEVIRKENAANSTSPLPVESDALHEAGLTAADVHRIVEWRTNRGYISSADREIYDSYSTEALAHMADGGDIIALQKLAMIASGDANRAAATGLMMEAAARGSTFALAEIGNWNVTDYLAEPNGSARRNLAIEGLAWHKAAILRGDKRVAASHMEPFIEMNDLQLSQDEIRYIGKKSQEILEQVESFRDKLGFDRFMNEVPEEVQIFHEISLRNIRDGELRWILE